MKYHWQSAWYVDVMKWQTGDDYLFIHVFMETKPPWGVRAFFLNEATLDMARTEYYHLLPEYQKCVENDYWPSYPTGLEDLSLV